MIDASASSAIDLTGFNIYPRFFVAMEEEKLDGDGDGYGDGYGYGNGGGGGYGGGYGYGYIDDDGDGFTGDICDLYTPSDVSMTLHHP